MDGQQSSCKLKPHKHLPYIQLVEKTSGGHSHPIVSQRKDATELVKEITEMILIRRNKRARNQKLQNTANVVRYRIKIDNNAPAEKECSHKIRLQNELVVSDLVFMMTRVLFLVRFTKNNTTHLYTSRSR